VREAKALKTAGREASFIAHAQRDSETKRDSIYIFRFSKGGCLLDVLGFVSHDRFYCFFWFIVYSAL